MKYVDASALLRVLFAEPGPAVTMTRGERLVSSELVEVAGGGAPTTRWQEAFEADLQDVFRVQTEMATKVARSLELELSVNERGRLSSPPTSNLAAYDAYLKGREIERAAAGLPTRRRALAQYEQAVALDPGFALAWARLSISHSAAFRSGPDSSCMVRAWCSSTVRPASLARLTIGACLRPCRLAIVATADCASAYRNPFSVLGHV